MFERVFSAETEVIRADLLDDGEKVRHNPEKLARVVTACCEQARGVRPTAVHF
jgi:hypothetical protein